MDVPRVLIVAENCSTVMGGEAIIPHHLMRIATNRGRDVRLFTHVRNRKRLSVDFPDAQITYAPETRQDRVLSKLNAKLPGRIGYFTARARMRKLFDLRAKRHARALAAAGEIDLVHVAFPVSPKDPSVIHDVGVPVIFGPMNGGMTHPPALKPKPSVKRRLIGLFEAVAFPVARQLSKRRPGKRRAARLLVANERTRDALEVGNDTPVEILVENGVDLTVWQGVEPARDDGGPVRFAYLGRLVDWKAVDLLVRAFAQLHGRNPDTHLEVIGDGPERPRLEAMARELGVAGAVTFHGFVPQAEAAKVLARSSVLALSSLHECGGAVVLEAMASGMPVVATKWGGPVDYLDDTCGVLVEPAEPEAFVAAFADAMAGLAADADLRRRMGEAGKRKVAEQFDWERKMDRIEAIWAEVASTA